MTHDEEMKIRLEIQNIDLANKKLIEDTLLLEKKNATFMITLLLAAVAVGIGIAKLFL